jgi:hypothetical protein
MSQFQQQTHQGSPVSTLDFENLLDQQRRLLKDMSPSKLSNVNETKPENTVTTNKLDKSDDLSSANEEEWISNWQFERISSNKKTTGINSITTSANIKTKSKATAVENEGGVFYFERIQPSFAAPAISSNPNVISTSDTNDAVAPRQFSSSVRDIADDNLKHDFDQHDFLIDMTIDNDDLFADLEAAADSNDDSEISLDDLMDMEIDDDQQVHEHDGNLLRSLHASQTSGLHDVNDFLNKSTSAASTALMNDDDFEMTNNDNGENVYSFSSPITSKETISSSMPFGSLPNSRSPTSVAAHHMSSPPLMPSTCSMSSASTRPALQQMRKMMTDRMDSGAMPHSRHDSRLPCAEGMDEMYLDTLRKLSASMERSKKTRQSLSIPMQTIQSSSHYSRSMCVNQILQSVQTSSRHVDACLRNVSMLGR